MTKLHQLLAVDSQVKSRADAALREIKEKFGRPAAYAGVEKSYEPYDDAAKDDREVYAERKDVAAVVRDDFGKFLEARSDAWNLEAQKDITNAHARADVVIDGKTVVKDAPATWLLYMERELKLLLDVASGAPTRSPAMRWTESEDRKGVMRSEPVSRYRTQKKTEYRVVVEATPQHAAQVKEITADVPVGVFREAQLTGMPSEAGKAALVERIARALAAVKEARSRANEAEAELLKPADALAAWIEGD